MKYVTIPALVAPRTLDGKAFQVTEEDGKKTQVPDTSLHRYLMTYVINEVDVVTNTKGKEEVVLKIGRGYEGNKRARKLDEAFKDALPGDVVAIEDEDFKTVKKIIEERIWPNSSFGMQFSLIEEAWMEASDKKPSNGVTDIKQEAKPAPRRPSAA